MNLPSPCSPVGERNPNWKGGKKIDKSGYILVHIDPTSFFYRMRERDRLRQGGYIREHRLVMAKHLGRCLQPWEIVHHKNGIKSDNRLENLEITDLNVHSKKHNRPKDRKPSPDYVKGYGHGYKKGFEDGQAYSNR